MEEQIKLPSLISFVFYFSISTSFLASLPTEVAALAATKATGTTNGSSVKLFVFGDSYADTGNWEKSSGSWHLPYGSTFPGKPTGRFSDGLVLTDHIASFLGIRSPEPYRWSNYADKSVLKDGMNFAHGGTGVFNTMVDKPNMTIQIDLFQQLLEKKVYSRQDLSSTIGLVSLAGNDYASYAFKNSNNEQDLSGFTTKVINQLVVNLKRIRDLGVGKIAVTNLEPLGCLPQLTASSSYENCSELGNSLAQFHNKQLQLSVQKLQNQSGQPVFVILDLHKAFESALKMQIIRPVNSANPLKPCCTGMGNGYACGSLDEKGAKKYEVCEKPERSFFWDTIHPSHNGWRAVYTFLRPSLDQLY